MDKRKNFATWFFEPEPTNETCKTENHKEERTIHETPKEIKIETEEVDGYPEKCLWNNVWFSECDTDPNSSGEDCNVENIESEASHVRIVEYFCDIDAEGINPTREQNKEKTKLSICCMDSGKDFCLPLKEQSDSEEIEAHTEWPKHKCFFFWFNTPSTFSESKLQMKPDNVENSMNYCESPKWNDVGKRYREKKPGEKESF
jgi:hypothetical protein